MDRAPVEEVDIHDGIDSTLTILGYRLKHGDVKVVAQLRPHAARGSRCTARS